MIDGRDVTELPPYGRHVGMVFQDFLLFPHRTVAENIVFPLRMQGLPKARRDEQLAWVMGLLRLQGLEARYPNELSGGQKQRVALARGLVSRPGAAAAGRAARQSRPRAAVRDGGRDPPLPAGARHPLHLRHPQPGRSADHVRPDRGHAQRPVRAGRRQDRDLHQSRQRLRRRLRRHANRLEGRIAEIDGALRAHGVERPGVAGAASGGRWRGRQGALLHQARGLESCLRR